MTSTIYDEDGWIHTGDIGYFDDSESLTIVDRKKDIMKYQNYHVTPSEIEGVIEKHPNVMEVVVVGIPDPIFTDLPAALITSKDGGIINTDEIQKLVEDSLSHFKQLRGGIYQLEKMPLTQSGKVKRLECKQLAIKLFNNKA